MPKKITIDDLAVMIKGEFERTNKEIKKNREGIKAVDRKVDEIKMKFAYVAWAIDLQELNERVAILEKKSGIKRK